MTFFDKVRASAGMGNAKVDARVKETRVRQGGSVSGEVFIAGGAVEQTINGVYISVMTQVLVEHDDRKFMQDLEIQRQKVSDSLVIGAKEEKTLPFAFDLSPETPMTVGQSDVWLKTALDVPFAVDPKDKDHLEVSGNEAAKTVLAAVEQLGFSMKKVTNLKSRRTRTGVVQEFEFYPGSEFRGDFSELELVFIPDKSGTTVFLELDHKAKGLGGLLAAAMDMDESRTSVRFTNGSIGSVREVAEGLRRTIENMKR
ncbi:sporulation protein [Indiicoccus explosivorum]|uniref:sporulation protein n=1 Tax=Indiicoccus explosivorum TaxID=1917864 RepID=UPI000B43407C|nr:sporulation protein [Indiicoccus explosivorum]